VLKVLLSKRLCILGDNLVLFAYTSDGLTAIDLLIINLFHCSSEGNLFIIHEKLLGAASEVD
jgi:hypothetical protein